MLLFNCFEIQFEFNLVFNSVYLYMLLEFQPDRFQLNLQLSDITCSQSFNLSPITRPLGSIQFTFAQRGFYFHAPEKSFAESSKEVFNTARVHIKSTPDSIAIVYKLCKLKISRIKILKLFPNKMNLISRPISKIKQNHTHLALLHPIPNKTLYQYFISYFITCNTPPPFN